MYTITNKAGIKFMAYEQFKHVMMPTPKDESNIKRFLAGSLAGYFEFNKRFQ